MLKQANKLRANDGYITDSLGWAFFKLKRYDEAKEYLQKAVQLMPSDPIVNDHYADTLWMTGEKIQARYYWNYVLNLEKTEDDLKKKINDNGIFCFDLNKDKKMKKFLASKSGWVTIESDNPFVNGFYIEDMNSGIIGGDHIF